MDKQSLIKGAGFLLLVFLAAFGGVFAGMKFREARAPAPPAMPESKLQAGTEFPATPVVTPSGQPSDTGELVADGAVVMFLRLDCQPCADMVAAWKELEEDGDLEGVRTVGITADAPALVEPYRQEKGLDFPIFVDPERAFINRWEVRAVPLVVVVGPDGEITRTFSHPRQIESDEIRREVGAA